MVGYTGGKNAQPTYESVCGGDGHSEAIQLEYDESALSYEDLLETFLRLHKPNMAGKIQYRSAIMFHNEEQKVAAQKVLDTNQVSKADAADLLQPASSWHDAEEYHQNYVEKYTNMFGV